MSRAERFLRFLLRMIRPLLLPVYRWWIVRTEVGDPWEPVTSLMIHPYLFGGGSLRPFAWYLEGESHVTVSSIADIAEWLRGCEYVSDPELFNESDFWQHPRTFEYLRKGDCEDHALWAWRKLVELKIPARLMVGAWLTGHPDGDGRHAWVVYESPAGTQLLEAVTKKGDGMIRSLEQARAEYVPHLSVTPDGRMVAHAGQLLYLRRQEERRRAKRRGIQVD